MARCTSCRQHITVLVVLFHHFDIEFSATTDEEWCESLQTKLIEELAKNEEYQSFINMRCPGAMANKRKKPLDFAALEPRSSQENEHG